MEVLGYLIFAGVAGMVGWHFYSKRKETKSNNRSVGGGGGRNPSKTRISKH